MAKIDLNILRQKIQTILHETGLFENSAPRVGGTLEDMLDTILGIVEEQFEATRSSGYQYIGIASPRSMPADNARFCFYLAETEGVYQYFGNLSVAKGEIAFLKKGDNTWIKELLNIPTKQSFQEEVNRAIRAETSLENSISQVRADLEESISGESARAREAETEIRALVLIGRIFANYAVPETVPGNPGRPVFYLASMPGNYTGFGVTITSEGLYVITNQDEGLWQLQLIYVGSSGGGTGVQPPFTTDQLVDNIITASKLADKSVTPGKIPDTSIAASKFSNSITSIPLNYQLVIPTASVDQASNSVIIGSGCYVKYIQIDQKDVYVDITPGTYSVSPGQVLGFNPIDNVVASYDAPGKYKYDAILAYSDTDGNIRLKDSVLYGGDVTRSRLGSDVQTQPLNYVVDLPIVEDPGDESIQIDAGYINVYDLNPSSNVITRISVASANLSLQANQSIVVDITDDLPLVPVVVDSLVVDKTKHLMLAWRASDGVFTSKDGQHLFTEIQILKSSNEMLEERVTSLEASAPGYAKVQVLNSEAEYDAITKKDPNTLYVW